MATVTRIVFVTRDNCVIMDRACPASERVTWDKEFIRYSTDIDARERGVKVMSRKAENSVLTCVVEYL